MVKDWKEVGHTIIKGGDLVGCDTCKAGDTQVREHAVCAPKMETLIESLLTQERNEIVEGLEGMEEKCDFCNREYPDPNCHKATKNQTILDALSLIRNRNKEINPPIGK